MEHPPPAPLYQDIMLPIDRFLKQKINWNQYRTEGHSYGIILKSTTYIYVGNILSKSYTGSNLGIHWLGAFEIRTLMKSSYSKILETFGVTKYILWITINIIFTQLKCSSMKHLLDLIGGRKIPKKTIREGIMHTVVKNIPGTKTYLFKDEEAYIAED